MVAGAGTYKAVRPVYIAKRSVPLKLLAIFLIVFSILNWVRFTQGWRYARLLQDYGQSVLPIYLMISGGLWGTVSLACLVLLWMKYTFSLWMIAIGAALYTLWHGLDRALLSQPSDRWRGIFLPILFFIVFLGFVYSSVYYILPEKRFGNQKGTDQ